MVGVDNSSLSELTNESLSSLGSCRRFFPVPFQGHRYELETMGAWLQMLCMKHIFSFQKYIISYYVQNFAKSVSAKVYFSQEGPKIKEVLAF